MLLEFNLTCEYARERKKRGKASRKDLAQQAAAVAAASVNERKPLNDPSLDGTLRSPISDLSPNISDVTSTSDFHLPNSNRTNLREAAARRQSNGSGSRPTNVVAHVPSHIQGKFSGSLQSHHQHSLQVTHPESSFKADIADSPASMGLNTFEAITGYGRSMVIEATGMGSGSTNYGTPSLPAYTDLSYSMQSPSTYQGNTQSPAEAYPLGDSPLGAFSLESPGSAAQPNWMSLPSPGTHQNQAYHLRYPVLQPLLPHLGNLIPVSLACDLLDLYFASSSSAHMHPMSPYVLAYLFRKRSFLHPTQPRRCSPALLASTLWVAAQTSDAAFLTSPPSARGRVCQKLLELTVWLLRPLIHGSPDVPANFSDTVINGVALGGLGVAVPGSVGADAMTGEGGAFGAAGELDDVVTYIHLATVVSASEYKGASLRWWSAAWSLARELKLGRELPPSQNHHAHDVDADGEMNDDTHSASTTCSVTEEEREERRRIWWLSYTIDRHLSLCYNKPLFLLDVECDGLLQPMDEAMWQAGEYDTGESSIHITSPIGSASIRRRGPNFECTGHSIFGFFLPLMTMLGEIIDMNHAKNHPRFGIGFRSSQEWDEYTNAITQQLDAYERSLKEFERKNLSTSNDNQTNNTSTDASKRHVNKSTSRFTTESDIQTRIVVAYGTHVMHVLHILLTGKWDPISLLDDNDLWISSQSFITAAGHAVSAAEAIEHILEYDPGLEFIPFFFGVYLLQGSFLLLLIADKLQAEASPSVVKACETIVRAHEACVVTLNTEYQVSLSPML